MPSVHGLALEIFNITLPKPNADIRITAHYSVAVVWQQFLGGLIGPALGGALFTAVAGLLVPMLNQRNWREQKTLEELLSVAQRILATFAHGDRLMSKVYEDRSFQEDADRTYYDQVHLLRLGLLLCKDHQRLMPTFDECRLSPVDLSQANYCLLHQSAF